MKNPQSQLTEYLEKLIFRLLHVKSLNRQVRLISEWQSPDRIIALEIGSYFFELTLYSFGRTILLELCKLVSDREEKSILDWLSKAHEHAYTLRPSVYRPNLNYDRDRKILSPQEYIGIIEEHHQEIKKHEQIIQNLKTRRDKVIAHTDRSYFNDPQKLHELFPLSELDISSLIDTLSEILRKHHSLLLEADISMDILSSHDVDLVLQYVRAFSRVWKDRELTKKHGIRVRKYLEDDYQI